MQVCYYILDYQWVLLKVDGAPYSSLVMAYLCGPEMEIDLCPLFRSFRELEECSKIAGLSFSESHIKDVCSQALSHTLTAFARQDGMHAIVP